MSVLPEQLTLADAFPDLVLPEAEGGATISDRFAAFHAANPHLFYEFERLALELVGRGHKRISMKMLYEVVRHSAMRVRTDDSYRLNNSFTALYARALADRVPDLADVFEFRVRRSA